MNFYFTHPILNPDVLLTPLQARSSQDFARNWWFHHDDRRCSLVRSSSLMKTRFSHFMFCNEKENKRVFQPTRAIYFFEK